MAMISLLMNLYPEMMSDMLPSTEPGRPIRHGRVELILR
jgi:hypothetical protein